MRKLFRVDGTAVTPATINLTKGKYKIVIFGDDNFSIQLTKIATNGGAASFGGAMYSTSKRLTLEVELTDDGRLNMLQLYWASSSNYSLTNAKANMIFSADTKGLRINPNANVTIDVYRY